MKRSIYLSRQQIYISNVLTISSPKCFEKREKFHEIFKCSSRNIMSHLGQSKGNNRNQFHLMISFIKANPFHVFISHKYRWNWKQTLPLPSFSAMGKQNMQMVWVPCSVNLFHVDPQYCFICLKKSRMRKWTKCLRKEAQHVCDHALQMFWFFWFLVLFQFVAFVCRNMFVILNATEKKNM